MSAQMICPNCGTVGVPKSHTKGSFGVELLLWLLFLLPGLLYSLWRLGTRYKGCAACGQPGLIPLGTPRAQEILARHPAP
ncbi:MAG: hypothetical protein HY825_13410 [Acidobacteria bacterium]|nr:hypothetical protein [Acidobacteriota bacterium]